MCPFLKIAKSSKSLHPTGGGGDAFYLLNNLITSRPKGCGAKISVLRPPLSIFCTVHTPDSILVGSRAGSPLPIYINSLIRRYKERIEDIQK